MLVSYNWVKEYFPNLELSAAELGEAITRTGIEIEGVEELGSAIKNIVVGEVISCEKHPDAEKLNKCQVDVGEETVQIICGAPNVAAGQKVVVARVGARLPGGVKIKRAKLRGEVSEGMICSLTELGFESKVVPKAYADGIFVLPEMATVGENAVLLLGLDDAILDMAITPNRADALSMNGVANEVAAIVNEKPQLAEQPDIRETGDVADYISVSIQDRETTDYYGMKIVRNIQIKESPMWLQTKLMKAGIRPLNNVVDVTNYINLLYGQPLHAFDYDRLGSKEIVVRLATKGEKIQTLDGEERNLAESHTVITNGSEALAIAGIMGGASSEVTDGTTTIVLEGAIFASSFIGKASRELGLRTEASIRFDKGSDAWKVEEALAHGASLIAELGDGEMISGYAEVDNRKAYENIVTTSISRINALLGIQISKTELTTIFERLQFEASIGEEEVAVYVPSRRWDIELEADILEEVARIYGYDNIPTTLPSTATAGSLSIEQQNRRLVRRYLESAGLNQALTYSLISEKDVNRFALKEAAAVKIAMPMSEEHSELRTSIIPGLLQAASYNVARKNKNVALYETGAVFYKNEGDNLPDEIEHVAGLITGEWQVNDWQKQVKSVDFFALKGIVEGLLAKLNVKETIQFESIQKAEMHPGRTARILLGDKEIGFIGQVHPHTSSTYDLKDTYVFEIRLADLLAAPKNAVVYQTISRYPEMSRDIAILVEEEVTNQQIESLIYEYGGKQLANVEIFDIFAGESVGAGKKSMAYSLTFSDKERTLVEEEVTKAVEKVTNALQEELQATIR